MSWSSVLLLMLVPWAAAYNYYNYNQQYPTLCGLSALRGAAYYNYASRRADNYPFSWGRRRYRGPHMRRNRVRHGRLFQDSPDEGENLLFSAVDALDDQGCILKLLCHLEATDEADNTIEENILTDMFANISVTAFNAAFIRAADIGSSGQNATECDVSFSSCQLSAAQLRGLLQQAWGCGGYPFSDDLPVLSQDSQSLDQQNTPQGSVATLLTGSP
nr:uncharacterized protein LOC123772971 [Procambarus clarkii]